MTVYVTRVYVFECDAHGCETVTGDIIPANPDDGRRSAWRVARRELGWFEGDGKHFCPDHPPARTS
jgi:hypothetical protein